MLDPLVRFILNRVTADYVRLYKAGNAPPAERYAEVYPEHARAIVHAILFTKYRLHREAVPMFSVEDLLKEHPGYQNDEDFLLRLLEHELETASAEPDVETVWSRFPHVDPERLAQTVELVQLRRKWMSQKETFTNDSPHTEATTSSSLQPDTLPPATPQPRGNVAVDTQAARTTVFAAISVGTPNQPDVNATMDFSVASPRPQTADTTDTTGVWTPEQAKSIEWSAHQPTRASIDATAVLSEMQNEKPQSPPPMANKYGKLDEPQTFIVSNSLTVENFLGRGHWKDVYKAKQHSTQQFVALKHLRENNDAERESLIREVRTQAALTHQNIPPVFALDILPSGQAIVVEKLVDGSRWSDTIASRTIDDNLRILLEAANAVAFAHQQHKIIHRDLKPDNVIINDKYGEVYVIDWGLAADASDEPPDSDQRVPHVSQLDSIAGTPLYWAPEQADGTPTRCCPATDVFLLGALLYEILTGYAPYRLCNPKQIDGLSSQGVAEIRSLEVGPMLRAIRGIIIPPRLFAPKRYIPEELLAIAMKSLSLLPEDRYADAGDFIDAVKRYQHFSLITNRCDQTWRQFNALRRERDRSLDQPDALLSLTLRFLETSDIFRNVATELQSHQVASGISIDTDAQAHPTLLSAQQGEVEARTELIALTFRSGDLTLADAQIGLVECNPLHDAEKTRSMRNDIRTLKTSRRRARLMKWIAVGLLGIFLGTSTLYGYLLNEQYKRRALEHHHAEEELQKARNVVNNFFTNTAKINDVTDAGLVQFRRDLLNLARQYHDDFVAQKSDDPNVIVDQVSSLFQRADIEAQFGYSDDAIKHYLRAIDFGNELVAKYPNNAKYLDILAKCYEHLAAVYDQVQFPPEQILDNYLKALAINRRLVAEHGDIAEYHYNLARILHNLGTWKLRYNSKEAEKYFRDSLGVRDGTARFDNPLEYHFGKAQTHYSLALLCVADERFSEADYEFKMASSFLDVLRNQHPDRFRNDESDFLGKVLFGWGEMKFNENQPEVAHSYLSRALDHFGILVKMAPEHIGHQQQLDDTSRLVFECLVREAKNDAALALFQQREKILLETATLFPGVIQFLCRWYLRIADFYLEQGQRDEAIQALRNGFETLDVLEDHRTSEEDELWRKIQISLQEILDMQ